MRREAIMETKQPGITGLKKRQQIQSANKSVFLWVTVAAVLVTISLVLSQFLFKEFMFKNRIIGKMMNTNATLDRNIKNYVPLKQEVSKLMANPELAALKVEPTDIALQPIIDAMPTVDDRVALATSLQQAVLAKSGVTIESLSTNTFTNGGGMATSVKNTASSTATEVPFVVRVSGSYDQLKKCFEDMHRSIRPISIQKIVLSGNGTKLMADIEAVTYYASPKTTALTEEAVKP